MNSEAGSGEGPKRTGRPFDCITSHFTQNVAKPVKNNRYWWTCKYCDTDLVDGTALTRRLSCTPGLCLTPVLRRCPGGHRAPCRTSTRRRLLPFDVLLGVPVQRSKFTKSRQTG